MFAPMQMNRFYNIFKSSGEPTFISDNENFHHSKFAWYAKRSSLADINPKSHYLIAFNLLNPLLYVYLHALNIECFRKIWSLRCRCLLCCDFVTMVIRPCLHMIGLLLLLDRICKSCTKTLWSVSVYTIELWKSVHRHRGICPCDMHYFASKLWFIELKKLYRSQALEAFRIGYRITVITHDKNQYWLYWIVFCAACCGGAELYRISQVKQSIADSWRAW